jgi:hypothetical protein
VNRQIKYPTYVRALIAAFAVVVVYTAWQLGKLLPYLILLAVKLASSISHLSGFWWLVGGATAYLLLCVLIFSLLKIAGDSDRRMAETGRAR